MQYGQWAEIILLLCLPGNILECCLCDVQPVQEELQHEQIANFTNDEYPANIFINNAYTFPPTVILRPFFCTYTRHKRKQNKS